jgi:hypothetical protein
MTLFAEYAFVALVVALLALTVIVLSLSFKHWLDFRITRKTLQMQERILKDAFGQTQATDFDEHVMSAPGMQPFMHTLN